MIIVFNIQQLSCGQLEGVVMRRLIGNFKKKKIKYNVEVLWIKFESDLTYITRNETFRDKSLVTSIIFVTKQSMLVTK